MSLIISRRRMIAAGGATLVAPAIMSTARRAEAQGSQLTVSGRSLNSISASDDGFYSAVETLYPGLLVDPGFQKIARLALLITHRQGQAVRAFSVSWRVTLSGGTTEIGMYYYSSLGSPATGHISTALGSARRNMIYPGQSRLAAPFFSWTPDDYQRNPKPDWQNLPYTEPASFLVSSLSSASEIKVSLDAVGFSDWKMIGPDRHNLGGKLRARRNAEHDEALVVYRLLKRGASDSAIVEKLKSDGSVPRSSKTDENVRWYENARRFHAQFLLNAFLSSDRATFVDALTRLKLRRRTTITRLAS